MKSAILILCGMSCLSSAAAATEAVAIHPARPTVIISPAVPSAQAEEQQASAELQSLRKQSAKGVTVPAEALAAAHERFLLARYAANRERGKRLLEASRNDSGLLSLRRALVEAPSAEARHAILARNRAVSQALESEE